MLRTTFTLRRWRGSLSLLCAALWLAGAAGLARADGGTLAEPADTAASTGQFTRVGIAPLKDASKLRGGADDLLSIWQAQLKQAFPEVEFVLVDPSVLDLPAGPLLLEEAVKLGQHYDVHALLTGVFEGVEVTGGTWPNAGASFPSAKGAMSWRLVECETGVLVADGVIEPRKPKAYSPRIKDTAELCRRVLQDLARDATAALKDAGALAGTARREEAGRE
jgi:hypothetical protein